MANKYTVAIIDEEQKERDKFVNFFEDEFNVIEIDSFSDIDDLLEIIRSEKVDAVAIDYKLKQSKSKFKGNGDLIFKALSDSLKDYPAFILTNNSSQAKKESKKINPLFIVDKTRIRSTDPKLKEEFIQEIVSIINLYKSTVAEKVKRLEKLEGLRKKGKLNESDENEFLELNNYLAKTLMGNPSIPLKYFSKETNEKLDEIISKTNALIKKIEKKK